MSKKSNRFKSCISALEKQVRSLRASVILLEGINSCRAKEMSDCQRQLNECKSKLHIQNELACFRLSISKDRFGSYSDKVYAIQVMFDASMIERGMFGSTRGEMFELSRHLHYISQDLAHRVEREMTKILTENGSPLSMTR